MSQVKAEGRSKRWGKRGEERERGIARARGGGGGKNLKKQREGSRDEEGEGKRSRDGGCETDRQTDNTDRENSTWTLE